MNRKQVSLRQLDINSIGSWPRNYQIGFCAVLGLLVFGLMWWLWTRDKGAELADLESQESELRARFERDQGRAATLGPLRRRMAQMERQLQQTLRQLPSKTEMPDLITDISQTALATGIRSELFQPEAETLREFYAEKPIKLEMVGSYHQFGAFVSGVASLPRVVIMTMHDISLRPADADKAAAVSPGTDGSLRLAGTVKTYRHLDEQETAEQETLAAAAAKAGTGRPPAAEGR